MLRSLSIRDFVIVDRVDLEFRNGFTALTGETGAGKSILIDALAMVLGERGDALLVRQGAERADIGAEFDTRALPELNRWLEASDLAGDEGVCLIRRVIDTSGRSRGFINGRPATLAQLREAGEFLVDIHGQHQHQSLLRASSQRALLDAYGGLADPAAAVTGMHREWLRRREQRMALEADAAGLAVERDQLESQVRELAALNVTADEWRALIAEHARLAHAASLIEAAQYALEALSEGDGCGLTLVNGVISRLNEMCEYDPGLRGILDMLEPAQIQLQEAVYALRRYGERQELDPQRLREVELRLAAVHGAARKYRVLPEELPGALEQARVRLADLDAGGSVEALREREEAAHAACLSDARRLSAGRRKAAAELAGQVTKAMQALAMVGGRFEIALLPVEAVTAHGLEEVEFRVAAHKGMAPQPLAKVASGGELSRVSLALQTALSRVAEVPTLIFDEVDAGIGGRVAEIVGRMLRQLGMKHQVMCVTHLPQVAASADQQWQVVRTDVDGRVSSTVSALDADERIEELARMLGGIKITETTRKHAAEMLKAVNRK